MSWVYHQASAYINDSKGSQYHGLYAGRGEGKNNPILQDVREGTRWNETARLWVPVDGLTANDFGPLPCGLYTINPPVDTTTHGPYVMWLTPDPSNDMAGRSEFGIHGDRISALGKFLASEGCIVAPPATRHIIGNQLSIDNKLQVVAD